MTLYDMFGRQIVQQKQSVMHGINSVHIYNLSHLPAAMYMLKVQYQDQVLARQVLKSE
jgi:hypothetical protein